MDGTGFEVVAIGCDQSERLILEHELAVLGVRLRAAFGDVRSAIVAARAGRLRTNGEANSQTSIEPALFVLPLRSCRDLDELRRLVDAGTGRPILGIVEAERDPDYLFEANRAGADQLVPLSRFAEELPAALDRLTRLFAGRGRGSTVLAVSGVSGGCGATSLAINLAVETARLRLLRCLLVEPSPRMGKLAVYLNVNPEYTTADLFGKLGWLDAFQIRRAFCPVQDGVEALVAPFRALTALDVPSEEVSRLLESLRRLSNVVVADMPCTFDNRYFQEIATVDRLILVAEPKLASLHPLGLVYDALADDEHHVPPLIVLNRFNAKSDVGLLAKLREQFPEADVRLIANDHPGVSGSLQSGLPLFRHAPRSPVLADLKGLIADLFPEPAPVHTGSIPSRPFGNAFARLLARR